MSRSPLSWLCRSLTIGIIPVLLLPSASYSEWQTICQKKICMLQNQIRSPTDQKVLARISMRRLTAADREVVNSETANQMFAVLFLPLGIHIPSGVTVIISEEMLLKANLLDCTKKYGCRAAFAPTSQVLEEMGKQEAITVSIVLAEEAKQINFAFEMEDFSDHLNTFHRPKP